MNIIIFLKVSEDAEAINSEILSTLFLSERLNVHKYIAKLLAVLIYDSCGTRDCMYIPVPLQSGACYWRAQNFKRFFFFFFFLNSG